MIRIAPSNPRHRDFSQFKPLSHYVVLLEERVVELVAADIIVRRVECTAGDDDGAFELWCASALDHGTRC